VSSTQQYVDCPNPACAAPAMLELCTRFTQGFGLQLDAQGPSCVRWDDTHCLICGHFSSPYAKRRQGGHDLYDDADWLAAVDRALLQTKRERLPAYLEAQELGMLDILAMRHAVGQLRILSDMDTVQPRFPQVALLRADVAMALPDAFGVAHGEAESEPFARKVRVLGRLLGADASETAPRHCTPSTSHPSWFFYHDAAFIGLLCLEPNRTYRGTLTIDGCLNRLLHAG